MHTERRRLIEPRLLPLAYAAVLVSIAALVAFGVALHGDPNGTAFDNTMRRWFTDHLGTDAQRVLLGLSEPTMVVALIAVVTLIAALVRRWDVAAVAALGPSIAIVLTEVVLKPIVDRRFGYAAELSGGYVAPGYAFPSGHETGLASLTVVLLVVVCRLRLGRGTRAVAVTVLVLWTVAGAVGLVRSFYHYTTDVVGAVLVSMLCVLGVALAVDALAPSLTRQLRRRRQLT